MKSQYFFNSSILMALILFAFVQTSYSQTKDNTQTENDTTITIRVAGITCGNDLPIICKRVNKEKGVADCIASSEAGATTKFNVTYNPELISYQQIVDAVQDAPSCNYPNEKPYRVKKKK
jgi:copper chaperone CopZ